MFERKRWIGRSDRTSSGIFFGSRAPREDFLAVPRESIAGSYGTDVCPAADVASPVRMHSRRQCALKGLLLSLSFFAFAPTPPPPLLR